MARDIICDVCQVEKAAWLLGNLETGEQTGLCPRCEVPWQLGRLDAALDGPTKAAIAAHWSGQDGQDGPEGAADVPEPKRRRGRPGRPSQSPGGPPGSEGPPAPALSVVQQDQVEPDPRVAETPAPADDG